MGKVRKAGRTETITERDELSIRRQWLEPGEATPWHTDAAERFSVIVRGDSLTIEYCDSGESVEVRVHPGMATWDGLL